METLKLTSTVGLEAHLGALPVSPLWGGMDVGTRLTLLGRWAGGRVSVYALYWDDLGGNKKWSLLEAYLLGQKVKSSEESFVILLCLAQG